MIIEQILRDSDYKLDLFGVDLINRLESKITTKEGKNGMNYYVSCPIRNKEIRLTLEEIVRQLYLDKLINEYGYPKSRIQVEYAVHFGCEVKRVDIVIMDKLQITSAYIVIELKKPKLKDGKEQLRSYCNATGTDSQNGAGVWNIEQNDPDPFMQELNKQGLLYVVLEVEDSGSVRVIEDGRR